MSEHQKLSALMRQGAALHPQGFKTYWTCNDAPLATCAIGAAMAVLTDASYYASEMEALDKLERVIGFKLSRGDSPEIANGLLLRTVIIDLNDNAKWTREEIADWLESIGY